MSQPEGGALHLIHLSSSNITLKFNRLIILLSYRDAYRVGLFDKWYVMADNILKELRPPFMEESVEDFITRTLGKT